RRRHTRSYGDWSSDVCSSDLRTQMIHDGIGFVESLRRNDVFVGDAFVLVGRRCAVAMKPDVMLSRNLTESLIKWHKCELEIVIEIGRASCRERVEITVDAVGV